MLNWVKRELGVVIDYREGLIEIIALVIAMIATYFLIVALAG